MPRFWRICWSCSPGWNSLPPGCCCGNWLRPRSIPVPAALWGWRRCRSRNRTLESNLSLCRKAELFQPQRYTSRLYGCNWTQDRLLRGRKLCLNQLRILCILSGSRWRRYRALKSEKQISTTFGEKVASHLSRYFCLPSITGSTSILEATCYIFPNLTIIAKLKDFHNCQMKLLIFLFLDLIQIIPTLILLHFL